MESNKILQSDVLDIIFDNRNKSYGAYELRKNYHKRARNAVIFVAIFAMVVVSVPLVASLLSDKDDSHSIFTPPRVIPLVTVIEPPKPVERPKSNIPPVDVNISKRTPPVIEPAVDVKPDDIPKPNDDDARAGLFNHTADTAGSTLAPPADPPAGPPVIETVEPPTEIVEAYQVDQLPEYPGGNKAMESYLQKNTKYPRRALENGHTGKVTVEFVIDTDGNISDIATTKAGYGFDEEARRVVGAMPKWKPGKINGKPVKVRFALPVTFELEVD